MDAIKKCDYDHHVIAAMTKLFWHWQEVRQAKTLVDQVYNLAPYIGDFWAWKWGKSKGCAKAAEPKHGEKW